MGLQKNTCADCALLALVPPLCIEKQNLFERFSLQKKNVRLFTPKLCKFIHEYFKESNELFVDDETIIINHTSTMH